MRRFGVFVVISVQSGVRCRLVLRGGFGKPRKEEETIEHSLKSQDKNQASVRKKSCCIIPTSHRRLKLFQVYQVCSSLESGRAAISYRLSLRVAVVVPL